MSGELVEIVSGDSKALIDPVGSALVALTLGGKELMPMPSEPRHQYHGVALAPWPNRIASGSYSFDGANYQLPINEPFGNALHGFSFKSQAEIRNHSQSALELEHVISSRADYPFELSISLTFEISLDALSVRTKATNLGEMSAPVGLGTHPFFVFDSQSSLEVFAQRAAIHDANMMPVSEVDAGEIGFGRGKPRELEGLSLDVQFSEISEVCAVLETKDHSFEVFQQGANWLMVYTTQEFNWADGRTRAVAIEPQTCAADAFNSSQGLTRLQPRESFQYSWGVRIKS